MIQAGRGKNHKGGQDIWELRYMYVIKEVYTTIDLHSTLATLRVCDQG